MILTTPRSEQGQMFERAYGWAEGGYYMREHNRSTGTARWYRADEDSANALGSYIAGGEDEPPAVAEWTPCAEPEVA